MAYNIGYVDNAGSEGLAHWQMLLQIKTAAEAAGWETLRYNAPTDGSPRELILRGKGLSGDQQIYIGFRAYHNVAADYYNVTCAGFTGYVASNAFTVQPGYYECAVPAHNRRIDYWLIANAQRVCLGLKVGTPVYGHGGAGFFLPYASPRQYPYPMFVAGMVQGAPAIRYSDATLAMPYKGNRSNFVARVVDGTWQAVQAWPWNNDYLAGRTQLRDTDGQYPLLPIVLCDAAPNIYGELDGLQYVSGFDNVTEKAIQIGGQPVSDDASWTSLQRVQAIEQAGGKPYVMLQDSARTGFADYVAMRMD